MTDSYWLSHGQHDTPEEGRCAMEWVAYVAGEPHSDRPACVSPMLRSYGINLNDSLPDDLRQSLRPYLARCIGTRGDGHDERRGFLCADYAVRVFAPIELDARGHREDAERLRSLDPVVDRESAAHAAAHVAHAAHTAADAAHTAAYAHTADAAAHAAHAAAHVGRAASWQVVLPHALELFDRMLPTEPLTIPALPDEAERLVTV